MRVTNIFYRLTEIRYEVSESQVRDCSNIGKHSLVEVAECRDAALELGNVFRFEGSWPLLPKGCISGYGILNGMTFNGMPFFSMERTQGWNAHDTGAAKEKYYPVCKKYYDPSGNYKH